MNINISEGRVGAGVIQGIVSLVLGILLFVINPFVSLAFIVLAIAFFAAQSGLMLDFQNKRYRKYVQIFGFRSGSWIALPDAIQVELALSVSNSQRPGGSIYMGFGNAGGFYGGRSSKSMSYDLLLVGNNGKKITLFEFNQYKVARVCLNHFMEQGVPGFDRVAEKMAQNKMNRRR